MVSQAEKDAAVLSDTFNNLTESIRKSAAQSGKLKQTFLDLSSTANASGQAWTVVSRLTSGTGFWKIQNRIRAFSNFFQFQEKRLNEQVERETKQIQLIKDQIVERERLARAQMTLNKIQDGSASSAERQAFFMSDQFRYLEGIFGRSEAILKMSNKITTAQSNLERNAGIRRDVRAEAMRRDFEGNLSPLQRFLNPRSRFLTGRGSKAIANFVNQQILGRGPVAGMDIEGTQAGFFRKMTKEQQGIFAEMFDANANFKQLSQDSKIIAKETEKVNEEYNEIREQFNTATDEADKIILRGKLTEISQRKEELEERKKITLEQEQEAKKERNKKKQELRALGIETKVGRGKDGKVTIEKVNQGNLTLIERIKKTKFFERAEARYKQIKDIPFKAIFSSLGSFLRAFLVYGAALMITLIALKQSGILDKIIEFFGFVFEYLYNIYTSVVEFFSTFFGFITNIVNFIMATLFGTAEDQQEALSSLGKSLITFLIDGIGGLLANIIGGIFNTVFLGGLQILGYSISESFGESIEKLREYFAEQGGKISSITSGVGATAGGIAGMKKGAMIGAKFGPYGAVVGGILGGSAGAFLGGGGGHLVGQAAESVLGVNTEGKFMGGVIAGKAIARYLVGERGPELVDLPAGAFVNSNTRTRQLLNQFGLGGGGDTINIYVNGRIGASETELRDIGNRLGDIINNRGNRVGNTRMFR